MNTCLGTLQFGQPTLDSNVKHLLHTLKNPRSWKEGKHLWNATQIQSFIHTVDKIRNGSKLKVSPEIYTILYIALRVQQTNVHETPWWSPLEPTGFPYNASIEGEKQNPVSTLMPHV